VRQFREWAGRILPAVHARSGLFAQLKSPLDAFDAFGQLIDDRI